MNQMAAGQSARSITSIALDAAEHKFAENYCDLYAELYCATEEQYALLPKFYIRDLKVAIKQLPKEEKKALTKFFGLEGGIKHKNKCFINGDIASNNMVINSKKGFRSLQSLKFVSIYNQTVRECVEGLAKKVYDPESKYTNLQKAKYCHLYFLYISTFQYFPQGKEERKVLTDVEKLIEMSRGLPADTIVDEYKYYYKDFPDEDLLIPMIDAWLYELKEEDADFIKEKCQLVEDKYSEEIFGQIRKVKESVFENGEWLNSDFCRISTFQKLSVRRVKELCMSYLEYKKEYEWTAERSVNKRVLLRNTGFKKVVVPQFYSKVAFKDGMEMIQFLNMIEYLERDIPELKFHRKPFASYEFNELLKTKIE